MGRYAPRRRNWFDPYGRTTANLGPRKFQWRLWGHPDTGEVRILSLFREGQYDYAGAGWVFLGTFTTDDDRDAEHQAHVRLGRLVEEGRQ